MKNKLLLLIVAWCAAVSCAPKPLPVIHTDDIVNAPAEVLALDATARDNHQIYQVNLKLYGNSGAFGKVKARLDDIKALGTGILYLMPVYPEGKTKAIGSPYCIRDFKGVNASYGTLDELRSLVDAAHAKGLKVMFDWVANHTAWDNPWITEHPEWYEKNAKGEIVCPTKDGTWSDVAQLDYSNKDLWMAMEDALLYWVKTLGIDGYRCDYAHGVRDDFWKDAIAKLKAQKPGFIMLAESDFERMFDDGFDVIFDRAMKSNMRKLFSGGKPADFFSWYKTDQGKAPAPKTKLYFVTNHDDATEGTPAEQFGSNEAALAAYVLMTALNGSSMLYGSQEAGYAKTINFFNTMTMDWNSAPALTVAYSNALQALEGLDRSGAMKAYALGSMVLVTYGGKAAVAVNTGKTTETFGLPAGVGGMPEKLTLGAYEYKVF